MAAPILVRTSLVKDEVTYFKLGVQPQPLKKGSVMPEMQITSNNRNFMIILVDNNLKPFSNNINIHGFKSGINPPHSIETMRGIKS